MKGALIVVEVIGFLGLILVNTCGRGSVRAEVTNALGGGSVYYLRSAVYERGCMESFMVYIYRYIYIRVRVRVMLLGLGLLIYNGHGYKFSTCLYCS